MISKSLMAASTKPIILSLLSMGEDYGYNLIQRVKDVSGGALEWSDGMLYPVLQKMEKDGVLSSRWVISEGGRYRKYYVVTEEGRMDLAAEIDQWRRVAAALDKFFEPVPAAGTRS
jgi:DNA-binding PadR family transcriptional regulator